MKKYFIHDGNEQQGPFTLEELKKQQINKETSIWFEGQENWIKASEIEELNVLFAQTPPPFQKEQSVPPHIDKPEQENNSTDTKKKERTALKKGLNTLRVLALIAILGFVAYILYQNSENNNGSSASFNNGYEEKVMTIEEIEKTNPTKFLDASGTYNENFWGTKMNINVEVKNKATVANYKDVIIEVYFYSETETELSKERYVIYDYFPSGITKTVKLKIDKPSACKKLGWEAVNATAY